VKKSLLIDGDQFIFKACVAVEEEVRWDDQNHVLYANFNKAWGNLTGMMDRIFERFETREHAMCFSEPPNFRFEIDPTYKGKRDPRKPLCYARVREAVNEQYNCISMPGLEADDVMGILATKPQTRFKHVIVSQDKDMRTIPADVWNGEHLLQVTPEEADRFHLYQTLIGDSSDGYPGCPGVGPVAAEKFLEAPYRLIPREHTFTRGPRKGTTETRWEPLSLAQHDWSQLKGNFLWTGVVSHYEAAGLTEADALKQARLARILRWSDWDRENKRPILWTP
jgi:hypothetical protein